MEGTKIDIQDCITFAKVLQVVLSPFIFVVDGGKSGQHRAPCFLTGRLRRWRRQQVPQKTTAESA